jgi:predicted RNA polymerase sigma factor
VEEVLRTAAPQVAPAADEDDGDRDDSLVLLLMCCHPALPVPAQVALTLRAVGGLTTGEIARAFLVPEPTMGQRISRAKQRIMASGIPFGMPPPDERARRLEAVLSVLYLIFNEGYTSTSGPELQRVELSAEAIGLTRMVRRLLPEDAEVAGLLALMLLTDARRPARSRPDGELVPLRDQDRRLWTQEAIDEGIALVTEALRRGRPGPYQVQAAIAAVHDEAPSADRTDWPQILGLYRLLETMTDHPVVRLNRAVAVAEVQSPAGRAGRSGHSGLRRADAGQPPGRRGPRAPARAGRRHRGRGDCLPRRGRADHEPARAALPAGPGRAPVGDPLHDRWRLMP